MSCDVLQDWSANSGNIRNQLVLASFRLAQKLHRWPRVLRWVAMPYFAFYQIVVGWVLGIELGYRVQVGAGLRLYHGVGLVVHDGVRIGAGCVLRHCTTLGMRREAADCPVLGDGVDVGSNCVIIGRITIGDGARIGAGSVVLHDVAAGDVVAGNPAVSIRRGA